MLYRQQLISEFDVKREEFVRFEQTWSVELREYTRWLEALGGRSAGEVKSEVSGAARAPGALPSAELERAGAMCVPFKESWQTHEEARRWALDALCGRVTFAADGSQLLPGREISLPVAAVQVASFENPHTRTGDGYRKEARFALITPEDLLANEGGKVTAADIVGLRRFELELQAISEFLERQRGWQSRGERVPVALFDGTLLLSSAQIRTDSNFPRKYIEAIIKAVKLSRETQVPLVGYIDQSYARDLVSLLDALANTQKRSASIYDAQLLSSTATSAGAPLLSAWGDRTIFCYCQREGLMNDLSDAAGNSLVGFLYLQTTREGAPARLDIPTWIFEAGLLIEVVDAVRAECVVGNGYPYAIETADAAAVITWQDREQFLRVMQEFAAEHNLGFRVSRKAVSKVRRR